jgi:polyhydroxybutyrate depolymerase
MGRNMKKFTINALFAACIFSLFLSCKSGPSEKEQIHAVMNNWKQNLIAQNFDSLLVHYSENFTSQESASKADVLILFHEAAAVGYLDNIEIDLESATLEIEGDTAVFIIYDDEGEIDSDFALAREEGNIWRIVGIPSETHSDVDYTSPYGDNGFKYGDYYRAWDIYIPDNLPGDVPLVIDLHGWTENPAKQRHISGFEDLADDEKFIVVWPYGLFNSWNAGEECLPPASEMGVDDVGFIRKMIEVLIDDHTIDKGRIYVTGLSNGAGMAQRLVNEACSWFAAAASFSLHLMVPADPDYTPVPIMLLYGTTDDLYEGAAGNFKKWKQMNRCTGPDKETWRSGNSSALTAHNSENGTEVVLVTIDGGGHVLYEGEDTEFNTTGMAWEFMRRFTKHE